MHADEIRSVLRGVIDPELGVNIVDLGLVYDIAIDSDAIAVVMTMTTPTCPLGEYLVEAVERALLQEFPDSQIGVELVWEPAWQPEMITAEGRRQLGWTDHSRRVV